MKGRLVIVVITGGLLAAVAGPTGALGQDPPPPPPCTNTASDLTLEVGYVKYGGVHHISSGERLPIARKVAIHGHLSPFVQRPNDIGPQQVHVVVLRRGEPFVDRMVDVVPGPVADPSDPSSQPTFWKYRTEFRLRKPGPYDVTSDYGGTTDDLDPATEELCPATQQGPFTFKNRYPSLGFGHHGVQVTFFQERMSVMGYGNTPRNGVYRSGTGLAVLAFRKTNGMRRIRTANRAIYKMLVGGHGRFGLAKPYLGGEDHNYRHVEVDLSRQVMALAAGGRAVRTYHVSTGAPGMPTIRGTFRFYRKDPGYNSHSMYYSVYFRGGYATHGYNPVPIYPASHGCVRNPIPNARSIYNWINLGMPINVHW